MSNTFWFAAGLLCGVAGALLITPFWRGSDPKPRSLRSYLITIAGVLAFAALAVGIYRTTGRPDLAGTSVGPVTMATAAAASGTAKPADSLDISVAHLETRLARDGGADGDWKLLAKSYEYLGRPDDAQRARQHKIASSAAAAANVDGHEVAVKGSISLDGSLAARVRTGDTLFIYAKAADSPGPPLAVLRTRVDGWPVQFELDDSQAMLPTRKLSGFDKVIVEARISRSGQAARGPGDLYGVSSVLQPRDSKPLTLIISREVT